MLILTFAIDILRAARTCGSRSTRGHAEGETVASLSAQTETRDHGAVALDIGADEIVEKASPTTDQLEQTTARGVILGMAAKVLREGVDAIAENRDLHFRRPSVTLVAPVLGDDVSLGSNDSHLLSPGP